MMKSIGRSRLSISAVYRNGVSMLNEESFVSTVFERKCAPALGKTVICFTVPDNMVSQISEAMFRGDVELLIQGVANPTERAGS